MTAIPKPTKSKRKDWKAKCIAISGKIVTHEGKCCTCPATKKSGHRIYPSHIVSRRYAHTAARTDNQLPQCEWCATWYTDNPNAWIFFVDATYPGRRQTLEAVARCKHKVDWEEEYKKLQGEAILAGVIK